LSLLQMTKVMCSYPIGQRSGIYELVFASRQKADQFA
jgi:hypothetical protein